MSEATVHETLVAIFRDELTIDPARVHPEASLIADLGFDSVAFAIGLVSIEEKLGLTLEQDELILCQTVGDIVRLIENARERATAPAADAVAG